MKKIILGVWLLFFCLLPAYADVYVIFDPKTNEVVSAIERDDAVLASGLEKHVLPGKLEDYGLTLHPTYYKFVGKKFIQNNQKISDEENAKEAAEQEAVKEKADKETAKTKLIGLGFTADEADAILR